MIYPLNFRLNQVVALRYLLSAGEAVVVMAWANFESVMEMKVFTVLFSISVRCFMYCGSLCLVRIAHGMPSMPYAIPYLKLVWE